MIGINAESKVPWQDQKSIYTQAYISTTMCASFTHPIRPSLSPSSAHLLWLSRSSRCRPWWLGVSGETLFNFRKALVVTSSPFSVAKRDRDDWHTKFSVWWAECKTKSPTSNTQTICGNTVNSCQIIMQMMWFLHKLMESTQEKLKMNPKGPCINM